MRGVGIGNGAISPYDSFIYADYLYEAGLIDDIYRDEFLEMEDEFKRLIEAEESLEAEELTDAEVAAALLAMGCTNTLDFTQCHSDPEESNYADYVSLDSTRVAAHTGDIVFGGQSDTVYDLLYEDIPKSARPQLEALLENDYRVRELDHCQTFAYNG